MAKLDHVIAQIQSQLQRYTNDFCDTAIIESVSLSGTDAILELNTELDQDDYANIEGIYSKLEVDSVASGDIAGTWDITFKEDHDQTYSDIEKEINQAKGEVKTVKFEGDFQGDYVLLDCPYNDVLTIESDTEPTGTFYLLEQRVGYNGRKQVTWIDDTHVSFPVSFDLDISSPSGVFSNNIRIEGLSSEGDLTDYLENEAKELTKKTMFVVMNTCHASKSREGLTDSWNRKDVKSDQRIEVTETFSVYIVIPTHKNVSAREAVNYIFSFRPIIIKCLQGVFFDTGFQGDKEYSCCYLNDGGESYNKAFYIHRFDFESVFVIGNSDTIDVRDSRAFREFELNFKMQFDDYENVKKNVEGTIE